MFNGRSVMAEECAQAKEMFLAVHEARLTASSQPLNQLVSATELMVCVCALHECSWQDALLHSHEWCHESLEQIC